MRKKILLVEDEQNLGKTLSEYLNEQGYECHWANDIKTAKSFDLLAFDFVILDIGLPDGSGLDLGREILDLDINKKILFLSAQNSPDIKLEGLEMGAADYMTKPFRLKELILRINKLEPVQVNDTSQVKVFNFGKLTFDTASFELIDKNDEKTALSKKEKDILEHLIIKSGQVVPRDELIELFWGKDSFPSNRTVDNYIVKFRKWTDTSEGKIEIQNIRGVGYKFLEKGKN